MAAVNSKEYVFLWSIENYSFCWHKFGEGLLSPTFVTDGLTSTAWHLEVYPRGYEDPTSSSIYLISEEDEEPENVTLKFEISVLAANGCALHRREFELMDEIIDFVGYQWIQIEELRLRKVELLPQDTLRLRCKIWQEEIRQLVTHISAVTRIGIQQISFVHVVENFSAMEPNEKKTVKIVHPTEGESFSTSCAYLTDGACCDRKIMMEITPPNTEQILSKCQLSLLDTSGTALECGKLDNRFGDTTQNKLSLSLSSKDIQINKSKYLPHDKLSVLCECVFATREEYESVGRILHEIPTETLNQVINDGTNNEPALDEDFSDFLDDLKDIYDNQFLTDLVLKTKTESFPAHKIILCVRSPVFKAMLNNMREENTDCIQIDDLDDGTVQQLLLFLYSDHLEDLKWETATKLYYASVKYEIEKLKALCSSFLKDNMSNLTAPELLLLADKHNDNKLKETVEDFILKNEEKVFCSDEWEKLIETNPQLGVKTMHLKYKKSKVLSK